MGRLFSLQKMVEKSLSGDMRQGPIMCACHLGFIQKIIKKYARNNNTTIYSRSFAEIYLHITKKRHSKP
jgi:hypothetical protein